MKATILESWDLELPDPDPENPWFLDWVLRSPKQSSIHLTAGWHAMLAVADVYAEIDPIDSVVEYFGGIGAQAMMAQELFHPKEHTVGEFSPLAVDHLNVSLPMSVDVRHADAYDPENTIAADLAILDFGDLTVWKALRPDPRSSLLSRVFSRKPKAVLLTDIACRYLHLHRERYETILGKGSCVSYVSYLSAFADKIEEQWGYRLVEGYHHTWSTVMALVPVEYAQRGEFLPTPEEPVGIEIQA